MKNTKTSHDPIQALHDERARLGSVLIWLQAMMTGLRRLPETGPVRLFLIDLARLAAFVLGAGLFGRAATGGGPALLALIPALYLSLAAAGRLRKFNVGHMHEAGHGVGFEAWRKWLNRAGLRWLRFTLAETCSVMVLTVSATTYMRAHGRHHRLTQLGTIYEPDGADLLAEGFVRGLAKGVFYRRLILGRLLNPLWYAHKLVQRLRISLGQGSNVRRASAAALWVVLLGSALVLPPVAWALAVGLPWFVFYPAATLLQVITEHPYGDRRGAATLAEYAARTWDRIPWDTTPIGSDALGWAVWGLRFALIHLPSRLAVLDTTMIWHRWHHLAWPLERSFDAWWAIATHAEAAWAEGIWPQGWEANTLNGLPAALERQRRHLETPED